MGVPIGRAIHYIFAALKDSKGCRFYP